MRQSIVGAYPLGGEYCEVVLREGVGADFYLMPEAGHIPRMKIGADTTLLDVFDSLMHEAMEITLDRMRCRYRQTSIEMDDSTNFLFYFNHVDFTEAVGRVSGFLCKATPTVKKEWQAWKNKSKEKRRRASK